MLTEKQCRMNVKSYTIPNEICGVLLFFFFSEEITNFNFTGFNGLHLFSTDKYFLSVEK